MTTTKEACGVCHSTGALVDIANFHPIPTNDDLVISNIGVTEDATGHAVVSFHVDAKSTSTPVTTLDDSLGTFRLADLVLAGTGDNTYSTDYWEQWDAEAPGQTSCASGYYFSTYPPPGGCTATTDTTFASGTPATNHLDTTGAANGDYSYTFVIPFGSAWPGFNNAGYSATQTKRLVIELSNPPAGFNKAVGVFDFDGDPGAGNAATSVASPRQFVTIQACHKCHGPNMDGAAHADARNDIRACDMCHSALFQEAPRHPVGFMAAANADLPVFIHGIHGSTWDANFPMGPSVTNPVTFPQGLPGGEGGLGVESMRNCRVCHSDPSGSAPGDLSELDNWKNHPSRRVCHSCHTSIVFDGATSFVGLDGVTKTHPQQTSDVACSGCHNPSGGSMTASPPSMEVAHNPTMASDYDPANDVNAPEYFVTMNVTDANGTAISDAGSVYAQNGGYFKPGDTFNVSVTLKNYAWDTTTHAPVDPATATDVASSLYTTAQDAAYVAGGGLHEAALYVYGPRSDVKPLLTNAGAYVQGLNLFAGTAAIDDATVTTDTNGFSATVTVPADATSGTYMIRVRIGDYDYNRTSPAPAGQPAYKRESFALVNFQIGTDVVQNKVDGDTCTDCHGSTFMHIDDHAAPFNTDHCTSCHDKSGGHGDFIGNRVHAIHSANSTGDLNNYSNGAYTTSDPPSRNWADITFPLGSINPESYAGSAFACVKCHSSGNTTFRTKPYGSVCMGCHGDNDINNAHMQQNGFKLP